MPVQKPENSKTPDCPCVSNGGQDQMINFELFSGELEVLDPIWEDEEAEVAHQRALRQLKERQQARGAAKAVEDETRRYLGGRGGGDRGE
ncbi:hypothetical protein LTR62_002765 [Meristemomyces frigidus]|uniref:Uncharacterized protein n=1 Tax=Meristemomyces frigidus TaxID=1508187 RepID=A0AAN7TA51_9PEZI|nr:hypothetical protein LTR62_002765 [Meristemomyces frigidus]